MKHITRDNLPHLVECAWKAFRIQRHSTCARLMAAWWGVPLGRGCRFNGLPIFRRHPESRISIGASCVFNSSFHSNLIGLNHPCMLSTLANGAVLEIGEGCGLSGTVIGAARRIVIGRNVRCGANTLITDTDWHAEDPRTGADAPVEIGDNAWLGMNVTVLKGVTIGPGTLVGAGSVVTRSLPAGVVAAGVPARVVKEGFVK